MNLEEALERAGKAYDRQGLQPAPTDVVAQNIGYRGANNGAALSALASLRYYGLLDRPRDGVLAVAKDYENYRFAPNADSKAAHVARFLQNPPLFRELLDQFEDGLPPDTALRFELIQRGFLSPAAASIAAVLKKSAEFAARSEDEPGQVASQQALVSLPRPLQTLAPESEGDEGRDRIPVRLKGGRRACLLIPTPFYEEDKLRLKAQIDLLLTDDEE